MRTKTTIPIFVNSTSAILTPLDRARLIAITFDEAPIMVPFPPSPAPAEGAHHKGYTDTPERFPRSVNTGMKLAVNGMLSMNAEVRLEIHSTALTLSALVDHSLRRMLRWKSDNGRFYCKHSGDRSLGEAWTQIALHEGVDRIGRTNLFQHSFASADGNSSENPVPHLNLTPKGTNQNLGWRRQWTRSFISLFER